MGFGLLLIGYFTATVMALNVCGGAFALVGYVLILFASKKLLQYDSSFLYLLYSSVVMMMLSAALATYDVSSLMYRYLIIQSQPISDSAASVLLNIRLPLDFAFTALMCFSVNNIARKTGVRKIVYSSVRNFVFYCIFVVLQSIVLLSTVINIGFLTNFVAVTALPIWVMIIKLVCVILNCLMLFSCYSKICDENDVDMPQKSSRFDFINRRKKSVKTISDEGSQIQDDM